MNVKMASRMERLPKQFFSSLVQSVNERVALGHDVINLGQGNPDLPTPPHIVDALRVAALNPVTHKYAPFGGLPALKQAVAEFYNREYGVELDPEHEVAILFGGKTGLVEISEVYLNEGDVALVPDPGYPDYWSGIALAGAQMHTFALREENGYLPDLEAIPKAVREKAKLLFLNYPNNPTGAVASPEFYRDVVDFSLQNEIIAIHDFAYGAIRFDGQKHPSFLQTKGAKEAGIEIYTLSKTYNMAGWRVAFAVGNRAVIAALNLIQDHYYVSLFGAVQIAAARAITGPQDCVAELVRTYESRRNAFVGELQRLGYKVTPPGGSFFTWLKVPDGFTSRTFSEFLLTEANVAVAPGIGFGSEGDGYVRVGLLTSEDRLKDAANRIMKALG